MSPHRKLVIPTFLLTSAALLSAGCLADGESSTSGSPGVEVGSPAAEVPADVDPTPGVIHWETASTGDEGNSTHLWIVDHAVAILSRHTDQPSAAAAYERLTDPACQSRWQQGLYDADYKAPYHDGYFDLYPGASEWLIALSGATWESHFYDPDTGENYRGKTSPVAKQRALEHAANADAALANGDVWHGCYELGLSLHYMTDMTQPMHTANFAATDWPLRLHTHLEGYAMQVQDRYARSDWSGAPHASRARLLQSIARASKALWPMMLGALEDAYDARCDPFGEYWFDHEDCWQGDAGVNDAIGAALWTAQDATAQYLSTFVQ